MIPLLISGLVFAWCCWMNCTPRISREDGSPIIISAFFGFGKIARPWRVKRSLGWPRPAFERLNWAGDLDEDGRLIIYGSMRPKESTTNALHGLIDFAVCVAFLALSYTFSHSLLRRKFSLGALLITITSIAILIRFVLPVAADDLRWYRAGHSNQAIIESNVR